MAAALTRQRADLAGLELAVSSAGFETEDRPPPPATLAVMARRGIDLSGHRSRIVTPDELQRADLVIGMTRSHVWDAALLQPEVLPRAFVFGELVRLGTTVGSRRAGESLDCWVGALHDARKRRATAIAPRDEVPDPYGRRQRVHEHVARVLERLVIDAGDYALDPALPEANRRWREGKIIWRP
jgi:protein-tyrosine-phosphatase